MSAHPHTPGPSNDVVDREDLKVSGTFELDETTDPGFELRRGQQVEIRFRGFVTGIVEKDGKDGDRPITIREVAVKGAWLSDVDLIAQPHPRRRLGELPGQTSIGDALRDAVPEGGSVTLEHRGRSVTVTKDEQAHADALPSAGRPARRADPNAAGDVLREGSGVLGAQDAQDLIAQLPGGKVRILRGSRWIHTTNGSAGTATGFLEGKGVIVALDTGEEIVVPVREWAGVMVDAAAVADAQQEEDGDAADAS